jgi:hypothetical protein
MDLLDRVGKKGGNKNSPDRMGLFQPQCRKAKTLLLAWLLASLRSSRSAYIVRAWREAMGNVFEASPTAAYTLYEPVLRRMAPPRTWKGEDKS